MATPIELGLTLEGEDARRFHEYMEEAHLYRRRTEIDPVCGAQSAKAAPVKICLSRNSIFYHSRRTWMYRLQVWSCRSG